MRPPKAVPQRALPGFETGYAIPETRTKARRWLVEIAQCSAATLMIALH